MRRQARSHSARETHARARRFRMKEYASQKTEMCGKELTFYNEYDACMPSYSGEGVELTSKALPDPINPLSSHRRDPFTCLIKPLTSIENFLLDYCECFSAPHRPSEAAGWHSIKIELLTRFRRTSDYTRVKTSLLFLPGYRKLSTRDNIRLVAARSHRYVLSEQHSSLIVPPLVFISRPGTQIHVVSHAI